MPTATMAPTGGDEERPEVGSVAATGDWSGDAKSLGGAAGVGPGPVRPPGLLRGRLSGAGVGVVSGAGVVFV